MLVRLRLLVCVAFLLLPSISLAQTEGRVTGVVRDVTRAALPGATVTATHETTRQVRTATTAGDGAYTLTLPPGRYTVTASAPSFARGSQVVDVTAGGSSQADFVLETQLAEQVTVTATKREQTLQEVPVAVSVVERDVMQKAQINDIVDLQSLVPSLKVTQLQSSGNTNFLIRGFGNGANNPGIEPSVDVFIDGVYRSRSAAALSDLPNVERIEVLRGPQSTLFGKNASAGVINVVTATPNLDQYGGSAELTYGNYSQFILRGDISGPLTDTLGFSLAMNTNQRDGYFENLESGDEINERDRWGIRGQLLFLPTDNVSLRLIADYDEIDEKCCGVANLLDGPTGAAVRLIGGNLVPNDAFAYENYMDFEPTNEIENSGISLQADIDFSNDILLTSITAYREMSRLDPKRFPGNPEMVERLRQQVVGGIEHLELQLRRKLDDGGGSVRLGASEPVPQGYTKSVAEYFRKLSKQ